MHKLMVDSCKLRKLHVNYINYIETTGKGNTISLPLSRLLSGKDSFTWNNWINSEYENNELRNYKRFTKAKHYHLD